MMHLNAFSIFTFCHFVKNPHFRRPFYTPFSGRQGSLAWCADLGPLAGRVWENHRAKINPCPVVEMNILGVEQWKFEFWPQVTTMLYNMYCTYIYIYLFIYIYIYIFIYLCLYLYLYIHTYSIQTFVDELDYTGFHENLFSSFWGWSLGSHLGHWALPLRMNRRPNHAVWWHFAWLWKSEMFVTNSDGQWSASGSNTIVTGIFSPLKPRRIAGVNNGEENDF